MSQKINIADYNLTPEEARIYVAFGLWLQVHPNGGTFRYDGYTLEVTKQ